jgi:hypothetical protein
MPPHMIQELGRATWGNLASEMVSFEKFTIQPWLRRIEGAIERDLLADEEDLYAEFLVEGLLRSDITTRYQAYEIAVRNQWMTPEEIRKKENLGPVAEGATLSPEVEGEEMPKVVADEVAGDGADPASEPSNDSAAKPGVAEGPQLAEVSLNGAQITGILEILTKMNEGLLSAEAAKALMLAAFPSMPEANVSQIVAGASTTPLVVDKKPAQEVPTDE